MKRYLALDTATEACSVALWLDGAMREKYAVVGREHTQRLLPMLHELLAEAGTGLRQLDALVCCVGPGSFAGLRIGVGLAKGLALSLDRPVVPVSSLALIAQQALDARAEDQVVAAIDARMSEIYAGAYARGPGGAARALQPDRVCAPAAVAVAVQPPYVGAGTGWGRYAEALSAAAGAPPAALLPEALPHAADAFRLAREALEHGAGIGAEELAPVYLRDRVALTLAEQAEKRRTS
ncbi:MAG: tRNA (adenosine(37)-N6)-threonylcarbamoyltransferase complex dimerization subunit type 1 TsaB [Gammaproteobacteria bacterium]|nr:tRNA (adenosine(37)-N6)-threonylcarbamoyltransferase complex dimerization subunit type 1 TsaB [Gammaproteobacteria bacterium]